MIACVLLQCHAATAQRYPPLTRIISFDALRKKSIVKEVEWTNPNGVYEKMRFTEMPIPVDAEMKQAATRFVRATYGMDSLWLNPRIIVFHAMGDGDLKNSLEVSSFLNDKIPDGWGNLSRAGRLPNGAHFIIDTNGDIICLTPPLSADGTRFSYDRNHHQWLIKRHQDGNPVAIGIENVTDQDNYVDLTGQQIESNAKLSRWLLWMESNRIGYLTSHHQFNDDRTYDSFLTVFKLRNLQKRYRTRGRKDIGDKNLRLILEKVNQSGYSVRSFFKLN